MMMITQRFDYRNPDYAPVIRERASRLIEIRKNPRKILPALYQYYANNHVVDFIEDWMWTYDPRVTPAWKPFLLWPRQREYMQWLLDRYHHKEDGLVDKSRDVGITWLSMAFSIWMWRFKEGNKIGFGSRKEMLVDRLGDPDSIFEKGRLILDRLPPEFLPVGFVSAIHSTHMKFINPENGNTITGEAGDNIGRGGRSTIYFKDESAFYERPLKIESALSQNSDVKIDLSTHNGIGTLFYQKRHSGNFPIFEFDWKDDPRKDEKWYNEQVVKLDPVIVAQEIDRDPGSSVENVLIPAKWVRAAVGLSIERSGIKRAGLDVADEGADKNALAIAWGSVLEKIESWHKGNTTQTTRKAVDRCREFQCFNLRYDKIGVGAGVKGETSNEIYQDFRIVGLNSGSSPTPGCYEASGKTNSDMFRNLRAQMWWLLRRRFEKTYEHTTGIKNHPVDEMISIPNDVELITELSQPTYFFSDNGKIQVESKDDMRKRGVRSPNKADAVCMAFAPVFYKRVGTFGGRGFSQGETKQTSNSTTHPDVMKEIVGKRIGTFGGHRHVTMIGAR